MATTIQHIGVGTAVETARRGIFFVELMRGEEVRSTLVTGFPRAAELAARCRARIDKQVSGFSAAWSFDRDAAHLRGELKRLVSMVHAEDIEDPALSEQWQGLHRAVDDATVDDLDQRLTQFIHSARSRFARAVEDAASLAWRNLATLCGICVVTALVCAVPQIRALVFEHPWYGPVALGTLLPVPIMAFAGFILGRGRARNVAPWLANWTRLGFFWRPAARYPSGYSVLSSDSRVGSRIFVGAATKALLFFTWLGLCATLFGTLPIPKILVTVGWAMCLVCVGLTVLAILDLWDFVHPAPVRGVCLSLATILWGIYSFGDVSKGIVALAVLVAVAYLGFAFWIWRTCMLSLLAVVCTVCSLAAVVIASENSTNRREAWKSPPSSQDDVANRTKRLIAFDEWPHLDSGNPVVVVAASGGGSRAAVLASLALEKLSGTPVNCGGSPAEETLGQHLQAISSVSGGSLASASYIGAQLNHRSVNGLHRKMADDFLQPVLRGAMNPDVTRGKSLEKYWIGELKLGDSLSWIAEKWKTSLNALRPPAPLPLFNSATLDGHAVVITPIDWDSQFRDAAEEDAYQGNNAYQRFGQPTWVFYRWGVYSLEGLVPGFDPSLAQAVRASANFPFGFPVVQLEATTSLAFSPNPEDRVNGDKEHVRLTDGGVVSNSGMWTLFRFLKRHVSTLRHRGVVLILVDATKMPEYGGRTRTVDLVQSILSRSHTAGNLHATMIDLLAELLGGRLAVVELGISPEREHNIYTSWALDEKALINLTQDATERVQKMVDEARDGFCALKSNSPLNARKPLPRLPLD